MRLADAADENDDVVRRVAKGGVKLIHDDANRTNVTATCMRSFYEQLEETYVWTPGQVNEGCHNALFFLAHSNTSGKQRRRW
jgi:hypothetical protein